MVNTRSLQIFLLSEKPEKDILDLFGRAAGFLVESTDIDIQDAIGFAQISNYTQGYQQGVLVTWPSMVDLARPPEELVAFMAVRLNVPVLIEPHEDGLPWLLAKPDGSVTSSDVNYLDDGIEESKV